MLVEAGFISNADDLSVLKSKADEIGGEIAGGIVKYLEGSS